MKKYLLALFAILFVTKVSAAELSKEVIIFCQTCPFCDKMKEDLNSGIMAANPDVQFTILDINDEKNSKLLRQLMRERYLSGRIATPLIFVGNDYMMGWGVDAGQLLQSHINEQYAESLKSAPEIPQKRSLY